MRRLTILATITTAGFTVLLTASHGQQRAGGPWQHAVRIAASQEPASSVTNRFDDGNALATRVLATLEHRPNVAARVRHQVRTGEHLLTGTGQYWQLGVGTGRRTRLELQTQVAGKTASLIQVFNSRYLWTDRRLPSGRKVTRLDPIRLQAGLTSAPVARQGRATTATSLISTAASRGGLSGQLADLVKNFDFGPPQATQLEGMPVYAMIGSWKPEELEQMWSGSAKPTDETMVDRSATGWPSQLPQHVLLLVGTKNLFPYIIEHRRASDTSLANSADGYLPTSDPLARFELFEVQFTAAIDRQKFEFTSRDIEWTNETPRLIRELGVKD